MYFRAPGMKVAMTSDIIPTIPNEIIIAISIVFAPSLYPIPESPKVAKRIKGKFVIIIS